MSYFIYSFNLLSVILEQNKSIELTKQELVKAQSKKSNTDIISSTILDKKNKIVLTEKEIKELE